MSFNEPLEAEVDEGGRFDEELTRCDGIGIDERSLRPGPLRARQRGGLRARHQGIGAGLIDFTRARIEARLFALFVERRALLLGQLGLDSGFDPVIP